MGRVNLTEILFAGYKEPETTDLPHVGRLVLEFDECVELSNILLLLYMLAKYFATCGS